MKRRNSLLTGLLNVLIPGSSHVYVNNDWRRFIPIFLGSIILLIGGYYLGNAIQDIRGSTLPQGLCPGALVLAIAVVLFIGGMKTARIRNSETDDAAFYKSRRTLQKRDDKGTRLKNLDKARSEGLISSEQYDTQKEDIREEK